MSLVLWDKLARRSLHIRYMRNIQYLEYSPGEALHRYILAHADLLMTTTRKQALGPPQKYQYKDEPVFMLA